jgi:GrpB-like predicted nucleotidyltransferase (UPF0157 family)
MAEGMLGLNKQTVAVVPHDPAWIAMGEAACAEIAQIGGADFSGVEHVGGTSVPGLRAKPILDIAAGLKRGAQIEALQARLVAAGYIYAGDGGDDGGRLFVLESAPDVRTLHLHVVDHGGRQWRNYLAFRDFMRHDGEARADYERLKLSLAERFAGDRKAYTAAKQDFIGGILARADLR